MAAPSPTPGAAAQVQLIALPDFPQVIKGDDVAKLIIKTSAAAGFNLQDGDIIVLAHKIISKAEGRLVNLDDVLPGERAYEVANLTGKDPKLIELILRESSRISRVREGLIIVRHRLGFTSANAGIDRSNVPQDTSGESVILIPENPDASAARLREEIKQRLDIELAVVIADSHGRPFRLGTVGVAIGVAGMPALWDQRGELDLYGYELQHTEVGTADEVASAASLLMGQAAEGTPVVLIRGLNLPSKRGQASDLIRPNEIDLYQ